MSLRLNKLWVPLLSTSVNASVVDEDATVLLTQQFANPHFKQEGKLLEAVYNFPLQSTSAIYFFKTIFLSETGEILKTLVGKAIDKKGAKAKYEEAKANGKVAQLLQLDFDNSRDVFIFSLGNIPSDVKTVNVEIGYYVALMEEKGNIRRFVFPATLACKRYHPGERKSFGLFNSKLTNTFKSRNVSTKDSSFEIEVNVSLSEHISLVESPSHRITTKLMIDRVPSKASVTFALLNEFLKYDFVLKIGGGDAPRSMMLVQDPSSILNDTFLKTFGDATIAKLNFRCHNSTDYDANGLVKQNFVFLVDRTGSMNGENMEHYKKVLLICLSRLPENCVFNICSFGSGHIFLFSESREYSEDSIREARSYVNSMKANMKIESYNCYPSIRVFTPLKKIVQSQLSELPKVVFLLTDDGWVWPRGHVEIIPFIRRAHHKLGTRIFTCGIGSEVSIHFIEGLAKAGGGTATFATRNEKIKQKLTSQMEQTFYPTFKNLRVEMGDLEICQADIAWDINSSLPRFAVTGQSLSCFIALETACVIENEEKIATGECVETINLIGTQKTADGEKEVILAEIDLRKDYFESKCDLVVPALKQQINLAEDSAKKSERNRAVELCLCANIVSWCTSLIAVEELPGGEIIEASAMPISHWGDKQIKRIGATPVYSYYPQGSGIGVPSANTSERFLDTEGLSAFNLPGFTYSWFWYPEKFFTAMPKDLLLSFPYERPKEPVGSVQPTKEQQTHSGRNSPDYTSNASDNLTTQEAIDQEIIEILANLQNTYGSYESTPELKKLVGKESFGENEEAAGFATAVAIVFMEDRLQTLRAHWRLQHEKAMNHLKATFKYYEELLMLARKFI